MSAPTTLDRTYQSLLTTTRDRPRKGITDQASSSPLSVSLTTQKKRGRLRRRRLKNYMNEQTLPLGAT